TATEEERPRNPPGEEAARPVRRPGRDRVPQGVADHRGRGAPPTERPGRRNLHDRLGSPMNGKTKLELTWIGKENRPRLEPRILLEDPDKSYHAAKKVTDDDIFDNRLVFGDNLLALKALEQEFTGKIKCVYIDPPYNTGSAFVQYDDG